MKKLLIGLLILGSSSASASYCLVVTKNIDNLQRFHSNFEESRFLDFNVVSRYGVKEESRQIETDEKNAFGEVMKRSESKLSLYEEGRILYSTDYLPKNIQNDRRNVDLISQELKRLGCH